MNEHQYNPHDLQPLTAATRKYQDVNIRKVTNGFIVTVGCKTFVSLSWAYIAEALKEYWTDPTKAEQKYSE